jgi:hypothetical protein
VAPPSSTKRGEKPASLRGKVLDKPVETNNRPGPHCVHVVDNEAIGDDMYYGSGTWDTVATSIRSNDQNKFDFNTSALAVSFKEGELVTSQPHGPQQFKHFALTDHAEGQVCGRMEVPVGYYRRVKETKPALSDSMLNHGLAALTGRAAMSRKSSQFLVRSKGRTVRGFLSDQYSVIDDKDIVGIVHDLTEGKFGHTIRSWSLSDKQFYLKVTCDDLSIPDPSPGGQGMDMKVGFTIGNSEVGARMLSCEPFIFRQACTNDAQVVMDRQIRQRHQHVDVDYVKYALTRSINYAFRSGDELLNRMLKSREEKIEKPADVIRALTKKSKYSKKATDAVLLAFETEPEDNRFGIINAFTRAAQSVESYDSRIEIERFGGSLITKSDSFWQAAA